MLFNDPEFTLKMLNHTEKNSALPIHFVPSIFSVSLDFQRECRQAFFVTRRTKGLVTTPFELEMKPPDKSYWHHSKARGLMLP